MTAQLRSSPRQSAWNDLGVLVAGLALASALELAILRTFTRTAIHIPAMNDLQGPYGLVNATGQSMYFAAVVLVIGAFVAFAGYLYRSEAPARHLVLFAMLVFAVPAAVAAVGRNDSLALSAGTIAAVLLLGLAIALGARTRLPFVPVATFTLAFAAAGAYTAIPSLASLGIRLDQQTWLLNSGEYLGVAFAVTSPLLVPSRIDRGARWTGVGIGLFVLVMFVGSGSTSRFLLLWNIGLSGVLPGVAYAAAGGALAMTIVAMARQRMLLGASGMVLLISGGIGLHSTYQSALVIVGLVALFVAISIQMSLREP